MSRHKKNRRTRRVKHQALKDYDTLMKESTPPLLTNFPRLEWSKPGDFFDKFTMYDESQISYTSSGTSYVASLFLPDPYA